MDKTSLYNKHVQLEAKILEYAGYMMPINYKNGIQYEYNAIRNNVGVFDVSHMGEILIKGNEAYKLLSKVTVNDLNKITVKQAQYTAVCNENGGIIDDIILYKLSPNEFLLIVNGSNLKNIFNWINKKNNFDCIIEDKTNDYSLLALQGPNSRMILEKILHKNISLAFYHHDKYEFCDKEIFISRTGYTGELGFEVMGNHSIINKIWDEFIAIGVEPCGLAVRDVLRLEMKYCLYGNDISTSTNPLEAGLSWIVNFDKGDFIGKDQLLKFKQNKNKRRLIGFEMNEKAIPRKNYNVYINDNTQYIKVGEVTSGTHSPTLSKGIGLAYVDFPYQKIGSTIYVEIRENFLSAKIVKTPFIKNTSLHK